MKILLTILVMYTVLFSQDVNFYDKVVYVQGKTIQELSVKINNISRMYSGLLPSASTIIRLGSICVDDVSYTQCIVIPNGNLPRVVEKLKSK